MLAIGSFSRERQGYRLYLERVYGAADDDIISPVSLVLGGNLLAVIAPGGETVQTRTGGNILDQVGLEYLTHHSQAHGWSFINYRHAYAYMNKP
ncbi:hypothetical protein EON65_04775 [archaeon]|nr:MAG: hypothetical protein EON65_04775 [archaeon]